MNKYPIRHEWCKDNVATLCAKVDKHYGAWPEGAEGLVMQHTDERECYFSGGRPHDKWNTTVLTRSQYMDHKAATPSNDNLSKGGFPCQ
jgi:hypothetical protein